MSVKDALERATGWPSALRRFGEKPVPSRGGWLFTLGSVALFLLLVQFFTGTLLATAYAPTPDHARASVAAIERKIPAGSLLRGLHHWGATLLVIFVVVHLARVLVSGAYRSPRQVNWWIGIALLLLVLAFAFTGYLLPWDQKGYWATVIGVRIAGSVPLLGGITTRLLTGSSGVGAIALTRFTAIHFLLLPAAAVLLAGLHLALLRRHGHAGLPGDASPREHFYPKQLARDMAASLVVFGILLALAHFLPAQLEATADPSDSSYVPRPEWYFLSLFQLLHYFHGAWQVVGTAVVPAAIVSFFAALPLLDRREDRRPESRRIWIASSAAIGMGVAALTWIAASETPSRGSRFAISEPPPPPSAFRDSDTLANWDPQSFSPAILRGGKLVATKKCLECHVICGEGNGKGLELKHVAGRRDKALLVAHFKDPQDLSPHSKMPPYDDLPERNLNEIADYLLALP